MKCCSRRPRKKTDELIIVTPAEARNERCRHKNHRAQRENLGAKETCNNAKLGEPRKTSWLFTVYRGLYYPFIYLYGVIKNHDKDPY